MTTTESIETAIAAAIDCRHVEVAGDGRHFDALVVADAFEGMSRVQRHQRVYAVLGDRMREEIHALALTTLTPAEWAVRG